MKKWRGQRRGNRGGVIHDSVSISEPFDTNKQWWWCCSTLLSQMARYRHTYTCAHTRHRHRTAPSRVSAQTFYAQELKAGAALCVRCAPPRFVWALSASIRRPLCFEPRLTVVSQSAALCKLARTARRTPHAEFEERTVCTMWKWCP